MQSHGNVSTLIIKKKLHDKDSAAKFTNQTYVAYKRPDTNLAGQLPKKYRDQWYLKISETNADATREVIAQELFRLFIPGQPKTRLITKKKSRSVKDYYIISKAVSGFRSLVEYPESLRELKHKLETGEITGLGHVMVCALLVNEIDLKPGNMGVDDQGRVIKIDGDMCFARFLRKFKFENYKISKQDISALPDLKKYKAYHWFDLVIGTAHNPFSVFLDNFSHNKHFRHEVNEAMLRIIIMPHDWIKTMLRHYIKDAMVRKQFYNEIVDRQSRIKHIALKDHSFLNYFREHQSNEDLISYACYLKDFTTVGGKKITNEDPVNGIASRHSDLLLEIEDQLHEAANQPSNGFGGCAIL